MRRRPLRRFEDDFLQSNSGLERGRQRCSTSVCARTPLPRYSWRDQPARCGCGRYRSPDGRRASACPERFARRWPSMKGFLVAGTASGVGKTTVTLAITAALRRRSHTVQPFKGGPSYLDTGHHTRISGRTARNLDTWMLSTEANRDVLRHAAQGADVLLIEGMMGLFDGK